MPFEAPRENPKSEFDGMSASALRENIELQKTRIQVRIVDPNEVPEIEALIERMEAHLKTLPH